MSAWPLSNSAKTKYLLLNSPDDPPSHHCCIYANIFVVVVVVRVNFLAVLVNLLSCQLEQN